MMGKYVDDECPLWVISRHSAATLRMSAFGGKADIVALNVTGPKRLMDGFGAPMGAGLEEAPLMGPSGAGGRRRFQARGLR